MKCNYVNSKGRKQTVKGMWQFIETTAEQYGLEVNGTGCVSNNKCKIEDNDERIDKQQSTKAAAAFLHDLIKGLRQEGITPDPELVLSAYHTGLENIKGMIKEYGTDFYTWPDNSDTRKKYGFGIHSYTYAPFVIALNEMCK